MTTIKREVLSSDAPLIRLTDGSYRAIGPVSQAVFDAKVATGITRITDITDIPFRASLAGIAGLRPTPNPALKAMATAASLGETLISQALPDGSPNAQYTLDALREHMDSISFANSDKLSTVAKLTAGLMTANGFDFTTGNLSRDTLGVPQIQLHGCMYWHNGNPSGWAVTAANVKAQLDIIFNAFKKNWDDKGYTARLKYIDAVNEIVDNAVSPSFVKNSPLTTAFRNSADWKSEMEALNIPEITADPGAFGFLYAFNRGAAVWGADKELAIADYHYAESTAPYGYGRNDEGFFTAPHQSQRWERGCYNIRNAMRAHKAGYPGRIDNVNFQSHLTPGRILVTQDLLFRNYEANMLGLGVMMGEMNLLLTNTESASVFAGLGIVPGSPEEFIWNLNYVALHVALMRASCSKLKMVQPWTDKTDFGDGALTTFDFAGRLEVVARAIQKAFSIPVTKRAIRAGRTLFGKANGFKPYELEGVITSGGPTGIRGTGLKLSMRRYLRRDVTDGQIKDMSATRWEQTFLMLRGGPNASVANGRTWYLEDAAGNVVLTLLFNAAGNMVLRTAAGEVEVGVTFNGDYLRIGLQYKDGVLKACLSRRSSGAGNPISTTPVLTQNVNLPAIAKIGMMDAAGTSNAVEHRIYDETHLSATDADFQTRVTMSPDMGSAVSAASIYSGSAFAMVA